MNSSFVVTRENNARKLPTLKYLRELDRKNRQKRIAQYQETVSRCGTAEGIPAVTGWKLMGYRKYRSTDGGYGYFAIMTYRPDLLPNDYNNKIMYNVEGTDD